MMPDRHLLHAAIRSSLGHRADSVTLRLYDQIDSTNTEAKRHAVADANAVLGGTGAVLYLARTQTGGRGRLGRSFHSPATGLYMTLSFTTDRSLTEAVRITAMAAVAAAAAVETHAGKHPGIKWVNDLYLGGGKLAGILCEAVPLPQDADSARTRLIVGLGMNITTTEFPADLRAPASSLLTPAEAALMTDTDGHPTADFDRLLGTLAGGTACRLLDLVENRPDSLPDNDSCLAYYRRHLLCIDERILCTRGSEEFSGILRGVDEGYSLLVEVDGETRVLSSGEISVRPAK